MPLFLKIAILFLILGGTFILGISYTHVEKIDLMTAIKKNVNNVLEYPTTAQFRNIALYFYRDTVDGGTLYYACGEVYRFDGYIQASGFKRFLVKVYEKKPDRIEVSLPLIEGYEEVFTPVQFDQVWRKQCR